MAKTKEIAEQAEQEMPHPAVDEKTATPHKQDAPHKAKATGTPALLKAADKHLAKAEQARSVASMQREIGNARIANALAKPDDAKADKARKMPEEPGTAKTVDAEARERLLRR